MVGHPQLITFLEPGQIFNMVNEFFEPIGQFFTDLWTGISDTASEIWTVITDYFSESWSSFIELANSILSPLGEFLVDCGRYC